jgi:hypothetical protein
MLLDIQHSNTIWFLRFLAMANRSAVADFHHLPYLRKGTLSCTPFAYLGTKNRTGTRHIGGVQDYGFYGSVVVVLVLVVVLERTPSVIGVL